MATQTMTPAQQDAYATAMLLQTGISMVKKLPITPATAMGGSIQIPLQRMGIMTGVMLHFTVPLAITAAATQSPLGPYSLVNSITYTDFAGVNRTKTTGFQLWAGQCMKAGDLLSYPSFGSPVSGNDAIGFQDTNIINIPTAITAGANLEFSLYVPMAYDPTSDLRGAVMTQTNVGEHYITIQLANSLVGADPVSSPYLTGTMTTTGVTVEAYQQYIQPQNLSANMLPAISLSTIYGFEGGYKTTANIAAGQSTYINYPNNRSILGGLFTYENGGAFTPNGADISQITMLVNSNTNFREMSPKYLRELMRNTCKGDVFQGTYYLGSRRQPILTQQYANVQAKFDVLTANAGITQFLSQYEVLYPSGTPMPGIVQ